MKGSLIVHFLQFFAGLVIVLIIIYSSYLITLNIMKRNWINSKLFSETLASVLSSVSSSTFNVSLKILVGKTCDVNILNNKVNVRIENEIYTEEIVFPNYIKMKESNSDCSTGFIFIKKSGDEVWIE
jgi:hypothetical protein